MPASCRKRYPRTPSWLPKPFPGFALDIGRARADIAQHAIVQGRKLPPLARPLLPGLQKVDKTDDPIENVWPDTADRKPRRNFRTF